MNNYYLKDHLGSIRATISSTHTVISAQDYDAWGHLLPNRSYNVNEMKYDYTGKERDNETTYDYFGARYYDSRIGRWGGIDTLFKKHYDYNPYNYVLDNPLRYIDPDGKQVDVSNPMYHINKETKGIQLTIFETHKNIEESSHKASPYGRVLLSYGIRASLGYLSATHLGFTRSIPFLTIVSPGIGTVLMTVGSLILLVPTDLNENEDDLLKRQKTEQEEFDKMMEEKERNTKNQEMMENYFNEKVGPTSTTRTMMQLSKDVNKIAF